MTLRGCGLVLAAVVLLVACEIPPGGGTDDTADDLTGDQTDGQVDDQTNDEPQATATHTLTLRVDGGIGTVTPDTPTTVAEGAEVDIVAEPSVGFAFYRWEVVRGDGVEIADPRAAETVVTMGTSDAAVSAALARAEDVATLTLSASEGGLVAPAGSQVVLLDESIAIRAVENLGYEFVRWVVAEGTGASIASPTSLVTTVTLTSGDATLSAEFRSSDADLDGSLIIQATAGAGGSVDPEGNRIVLYGTETTVTATPDSGYRFGQWTAAGDATIADDTAMQTTIVLNSGNATVEASFEAIPTYTLTLRAGTGGSVSPSTAATATEGVPTQITATPSAGYAFDRWQVVVYFNGQWMVVDPPETVTFRSASSASTTVTLAGNATIEAVFEEAPTRIAAISGVGWSAMRDSDHDGFLEAALLSFDVNVSETGTYDYAVYAQAKQGTLPQRLGGSTFKVTFLSAFGPEEEIDLPISEVAAGTYNLSILISYGGERLATFSESPLIGIKLEP